MQNCCVAPDPCCCVQIPNISCPPPCPQPCPPQCPPPQTSANSQKDSKYIHEVGAEMIGNQLIIRMEKDKRRSKRKRGQWDPPCDCETVEILRGKEGPKIINGSENNRILFRIHSKSNIRTKEDPNYKPHAIAYEVNGCNGVDNANDHCRKITVYPQLGGSGTQEVHSNRTTDGNQDVFFLRIKKKADAAEPNKRNIELELRTPKKHSSPNLVTDTDTTLKVHLDTQGSLPHDEKGILQMRKGRKRRKSKTISIKDRNNHKNHTAN